MLQETDERWGSFRAGHIVSHGQILELPNGDLLAPVYGVFPGDRYAFSFDLAEEHGHIRVRGGAYVDRGPADGDGARPEAGPRRRGSRTRY